MKPLIMDNRLSAYQCWKKKTSENLNDEQFKQLLITNGIIIKKSFCERCGKKEKIPQTPYCDNCIYELNGW